VVEKSPNHVYTPPMPTKRASLSERPTKRTTEPIAELPESHGWLNKRNVFFLSFGMLAMLALWLTLQLVIIPAIADTSQQWNYGNGRISQFDLNVGHGGTSHFVTQYWHQEVLIIEFQAGTAAHAKAYTIPLLISGSAKQHSVTLTPAYVRPHATPGTPDLVITVSDITPPIVLYNTGNGFSLEVQ